MEEILPLLLISGTMLLNMVAFYLFYKWGEKDGKEAIKKRIRAFKGLFGESFDNHILSAIENEED